MQPAPAEDVTPPASPEPPPAAPADVAAPPADAVRTPSGLAFRVLLPGHGDEHPGPEDAVLVHYTAWTTDGALFETTRDRGAEAHFPYGRGEPAGFPMARVIAGWREGLPAMRIGERRLFWVPPALAYEGQPGRPQGMLVFDVELLAVTPAPRTPDALSAPPDAVRSPSGLAWTVLRPGRSDTPTAGRTGVRMHYSAWTADGQPYDSSVPSGIPRTVRLDSIAAGLAEALRSMSVAERRRVWLPEALAYPHGGGPRGAMIYDLELVGLLD